MTNAENDMTKKLRERALVDEFFALCPDYKDYVFHDYRENPDLIYAKGKKLVGFESIIVSEDQSLIECHFDKNRCQLRIPSLSVDDSQTTKATNVFLRNLFNHIRKYSVPTVLVFTVMNEETDLVELGRSFRLPEFNQFNIKDYYLVNKNHYIKLSESDLSTG